jgi:DNA-binding IclR family transcriptional regulator
VTPGSPGVPCEIATTGPAVTRSVTGRIAAIMLELTGAPGLTLTELAQRTRLPRSTTHRLLGELVDFRLLDRHGAVYSLSRGLHDLIGTRQLAAAVRSQVGLVLEDLGIATGLRSRFGVWNERGLSYLERPTDRGPARCTAGLTSLPLHATAMGKMILAHAPPAVVQQVVGSWLPSYTPQTLSTPRQLHHALAATRRRGLAVAREELREGECAIAVPVFGPQGGVVAALELATATTIEALLHARLPLFVAARGLSRQLALHPAALPPGFGSDPLRWRADPTSAELSWCAPEVAG